jgi:Na+-driven multidrug efflux pump
LAWPALAVLAATPLYLLWDTAVVGRLGAAELAALGAGATVLAQVTTQLTFLSYGTTARAARRYGAGDSTGAVAEGVQATWVALGVGVVLAVALRLLAAPVAGWLTGGDGEVAHEAARWLEVTSLSVVPALVTMAGNGWLRGMSNTRWPLYFTLAGVGADGGDRPVGRRPLGSRRFGVRQCAGGDPDGPGIPLGARPHLAGGGGRPGDPARPGG